MTSTTSEAPAQSAEPTPAIEQPSHEQAGHEQPSNEQPGKERPSRSSVQPVLEKLFELYPHLFGAEFLPLKLGIFQELLANHPEHFQRDSLKAALGLHTRSARYLQSIAAGHQRHDLQGVAVEKVAPEHVYLALLELFRRRQNRTDEDLRPRLRAQLRSAFEASGLTPAEYRARVQPNSAAASHTLLEEVLAEYEQKLAKEEALLRAFDNSGKTPAEFAAMYGLDERDVVAALARRPAPSPAIDL